MRSPAADPFRTRTLPLLAWLSGLALVLGCQGIKTAGGLGPQADAGEGEGEGSAEGEGEGEGSAEGEGEGPAEGEGEGPAEGEGEGPAEGEGEGEGPAEGEGEGEGEGPAEGEGEGEGPPLPCDGQCPLEYCAIDRCLDCLGLDDCDVGELCVLGACVEPECLRDADCAGRADGLGICDPESGSCVACLRDADCSRGFVCDELACVPGCADQRDCPAEAPVCLPDGSGCVECLGDGDCGEGLRCVAQACTVICAHDGDCAEGLHCAPATLACVACVEDAHCPLGSVCEGSMCEAGCRDDRDCGGGLRCSADGQCVECLLDRECEQPADGWPVAVCADGACRLGCREPGDCRGDDVCLPALACGPCGEDAHCPRGTDRCVGQRCIPGCEALADCGEDLDLPWCGAEGFCTECAPDDDTCVDGTCPDGLRGCEGECVDPAEDEQHCGRCRNACGDDVACVSGGCGTVREELEPNNGPLRCQRVVTGGWRVSGAINPAGDRDWYCLWVEAGQHVRFDIAARADPNLNSQLDSYLYLHALTPEPRLLAENDDEVLGQLQDSMLEYDFVESGEYAITVGA